MSTPLISVLIIAYNYGQFIEEAIDSVLAQDFPLDNLEIIVVDDGSTDDTGERVKKYGLRVQYCYKPNGGQASALNLGMAKASGEIVALLDADDFLLPGKLPRIAQEFERDPALGMVYHRLRVWNMRTDEWRDWEFVPVSGDAQKKPKEFVRYITPPNLAVSFRRSALKGLLPIPEQIRMLADCYLAALIPLLAPVLAIPEFFAVYRVHGKNAHYTSDREIPLDVRKGRLVMWQTVIDAMRHWLADHGYTRKQAPVRAMLDRYAVILEREEFGVNPPGRFRFFRYLLDSYRYQLHLMSLRLVLVNYLDAAAALIVGYEKFPQWIRRREEFTCWARGIFRKTQRAPRLPQP